MKPLSIRRTSTAIKLPRQPFGRPNARVLLLLPPIIQTAMPINSLIDLIWLVVF